MKLSNQIKILIFFAFTYLLSCKNNDPVISFSMQNFAFNIEDTNYYIKQIDIYDPISKADTTICFNNKNYTQNLYSKIFENSRKIIPENEYFIVVNIEDLKEEFITTYNFDLKKNDLKKTLVYGKSEYPDLIPTP